MTFQQRIKITRERRGISQQEMADVLQTSQSYYAQYENGKRNIPFERMILISLKLNISLDYIAGLTKDPTPHYRT